MCLINGSRPFKFVDKMKMQGDNDDDVIMARG